MNATALHKLEQQGGGPADDGQGGMMVPPYFRDQILFSLEHPGIKMIESAYQTDWRSRFWRWLAQRTKTWYFDSLALQVWDTPVYAGWKREHGLPFYSREPDRGVSIIHELTHTRWWFRRWLISRLIRKGG